MTLYARMAESAAPALAAFIREPGTPADPAGQFGELIAGLLVTADEIGVSLADVAAAVSRATDHERRGVSVRLRVDPGHHTAVTVFAAVSRDAFEDARNLTHANLGTLTMREVEWTALRDALSVGAAMSNVSLTVTDR